jgi:hypothetical protein
MWRAAAASGGPVRPAAGEQQIGSNKVLLVLQLLWSRVQTVVGSSPWVKVKTLLIIECCCLAAAWRAMWRAACCMDVETVYVVAYYVRYSAAALHTSLPGMSLVWGWRCSCLSCLRTRDLASYR